MNAAKIAKALIKKGVAVQSTKEGDFEMDGEIRITELVAVSVPSLRGVGKLCVTETAADGSWVEFYPARKASEIDALVSDIQQACAINAR